MSSGTSGDIGCRHDAGHGILLVADGEYVHLDAVRLNHPPATAPPVLAGVRGPKSLELAGRSADGVILAWPVTPAYFRHAAPRQVRIDG